ncbi:MAG: polysaccharide biosynthesis protein, partial [Deltaproteobacteria bacterium]
MRSLALAIKTFLQALSNQQRWVKNITLVSLDSLLLIICLLLAFAVRFSPDVLLVEIQSFSHGAAWWIACHSIALWPAGLYRPVLRHAGQELLFQVVRGIMLGSLSFIIFSWFLPSVWVPRSIVVMAPIFSLLSLISLRLIFRWVIRIHLMGTPLRERNIV